MSVHLRKDMERLEKQLLLVAAQVEDAVRRSMAALLENRTDLAEQVIEGDVEIDRREVEVEEECLKILALHHPVATDLRFITACLKINNDLERVGDLAGNIAKRSRDLGGSQRTFLPAQLEDMTEAAAAMLRDAIDAFVKADAAAAERVLARDSEVDQLNRNVITEMVERIRREHSCADSCVSLISVSKQLERIADHATNIAEDVVYMVSGDIIRHRGRLRGDAAKPKR
jgi:phosphate transport system protein